MIRRGTPAPDTGLHRKEQAAPIDSVQELRLLHDGTHCIRCRCTFGQQSRSVVLHPEAAKHSLEIIDLHLFSHLFQTFRQTVGNGHLDAEIHGIVRALMRRVHRAADEEIDIRPFFKKQLADA